MRDGTTVALRSVLVHTIEEYARHCGHADLLRERIDGRGGQRWRQRPLAAALLAGITAVARQAPRWETARMVGDGLVGRWRLVSWSARTADGAVIYPMGERAQGSVVYTPGGWMSGTLAHADRPDLASSDVVGGTEAQRATAFSTYVSYCGRYDVEGDTVVHHVDMSLFPNWVGTDQNRQYEISGDELVLRTSAIKIGGQEAQNELRWTREE
jgi:hypothetical protein